MEPCSQSVFENSSFLQNALDKFLSLATSSNGTKFTVALDAVAKAVEDDLAVDSEAKYIVLFYSDGKPDESSIDDFDSGKNFVTEKLGQVSEVLTLSTVYFCEVDKCKIGAKEIMKGMAYALGGKFVNATAKEDIIIEDLAVVPGETCPEE